MKDWQATLRSWMHAGYLPSQKVSGPRNGAHPVPPKAVKPQPEGWEAWRLEYYPTSTVTDFWRVPGDVQKEFKQRFQGGAA